MEFSEQGKLNTLVGVPTLLGGETEKELQNVSATIKIKGTEEKFTVNFTPFILSENFIITSAVINSDQQHEYNGKPHNGMTGANKNHLLIVKAKTTSGKDVELTEGPSYKIISYKKDGHDISGENVIYAGNYTNIKIQSTNDKITFDPSLNVGPDNIYTISGVVSIAPKELSVKVEPEIYTIGEGSPNYTDNISFDNKDIVAGDDVSIKADVEVSGGKWQSQPGTYTVNYYNISLEGNSASNYTCANSEIGTLIVKKKVDPTDPNIKPGGGNWNVTAEGFTKIYDGQSESLNTLVATVAKDNDTEKVTFTKGKDYTISPTDAFKDVKEGGYEVIVTFTAECKFYSGSLKMKFIIKPRPLKVTVNEFTEEDLNKTSIGTEDVTFENEGENRGLLSEEDLKASAEVEFEKNGDKYKVTFTELSIENGDNGIASNYNATWYYGNELIDENGDGSGSIDIEDPTEGDGDGGGIIDYNDLHIIKSTGATLTSRYNKMKTPDGGSFTLSLEKEEGYEDCEPTVYYKRGRFGEWKELKFDEVSGYYQIRSVYTDIYVKVSGDGIWPVSNEEVEAQEVKVYTQNGAIVVVTPSVMNVQVVSMTGSVVAADKVAGQREFRNLVEGVYIVRVGDEIVKIRL